MNKKKADTPINSTPLFGFSLFTITLLILGALNSDRMPFLFQENYYQTQAESRWSVALLRLLKYVVFTISGLATFHVFTFISNKHTERLKNKKKARRPIIKRDKPDRQT